MLLLSCKGLLEGYTGKMSVYKETPERNTTSSLIPLPDSQELVPDLSDRAS